MNFGKSKFGIGLAIAAGQAADFFGSKKDGLVDADGQEKDSHKLLGKRAWALGSLLATMVVPAMAGDGGPGNAINAADSQFAGQQNAVVLDYVPDGGTNPPAGSTFNMGDVVNSVATMDSPESRFQNLPGVGDGINQVLGGDAKFTVFGDGVDENSASKFAFEDGDIKGMAEVPEDTNGNGRRDLGDKLKISAFNTETGEKIVTSRLSDFNGFVATNHDAPSAYAAAPGAEGHGGSVEKDAPDMADHTNRTARQAIERGFEDTSDLKVMREVALEDGQKLVEFQKGHLKGHIIGEPGPDGQLHEKDIAGGTIKDMRTGAEVHFIDATDDNGHKTFSSMIDGDTRAKQHVSLGGVIDMAEGRLGDLAAAAESSPGVRAAPAAPAAAKPMTAKM